MNCKKCGAPLMQGDQFCKNCGAAVDKTNAQNNIGGGQVSSNQNGFNNSSQPVNNVMTGQPSNNTQQPVNNYNNSYNAQPTNNQPNKNNSIKFIIIGVGVALVLLIAVVMILIFAFKGNDSVQTTTEDTPKEVETTSNYTVNYGGFEFKIPTSLVYETRTDGVVLGDENETWAVAIEIMEGSYNKLLSNKSNLQTLYQKQGYTAGAAAEKKLGNVDFLTLEVSKGGYNALLGWTKANSMYIFGLTAQNIDNEYGYDALESVASVLSSAEFTGETNSISTFEKVDMSEINELVKE